jgi:hypothetical protein
VIFLEGSKYSIYAITVGAVTKYISSQAILKTTCATWWFQDAVTIRPESLV